MTATADTPSAPLAIWSPRLIAILALLGGPLAGSLLLFASYRSLGRRGQAWVTALLGPSVLIAAAAAVRVTLSLDAGAVVFAGGTLGISVSAVGGYGRAVRSFPAAVARSPIEAGAFALLGAFATVVLLLWLVVYGAGLAVAPVR